MYFQGGTRGNFKRRTEGLTNPKRLQGKLKEVKKYKAITEVDFSGGIKETSKESNTSAREGLESMKCNTRNVLFFNEG